MSLSEMLLEDAVWWFNSVSYINMPPLEVMEESFEARRYWRVDGEEAFLVPPKTTSWYLLFIREAISD